MDQFIYWVLGSVFTVVMFLVGLLHKHNSDQHKKTQQDIVQIKDEIHSLDKKIGTDYMTRDQVNDKVEGSIARIESKQAVMMEELRDINNTVTSFNKQYGESIRIISKFFEDSALDKLKKG